MSTASKKINIRSLIKDIAPYVSELGLNESGQQWTMTIQMDGSEESSVFTVTGLGLEDSETLTWYKGSLITSEDLLNT